MQLNEENIAFLEHFGVKGMRWGVRRNKPLKERWSYTDQSGKRVARYDKVSRKEKKAVQNEEASKAISKGKTYLDNFRKEKKFNDKMVAKERAKKAVGIVLTAWAAKQIFDLTYIKVTGI
jgi:hypothetical protein